MPNEPVDSTNPPTATPSNPNKKVFQSSNLQEGQYDPFTSTLRLSFVNGSIYLYTPVDVKLWEGLRDAISPGAYFAANIRFKPQLITTKLGK